jgi:hypothetical protein
MSSGLTNEKGQGASHATQSSVPGTVQDKVRNSTTTTPTNLSN